VGTSGPRDDDDRRRGRRRDRHRRGHDPRLLGLRADEPAIHPGATENCTNGLDDDCDTLTDTADPDCAGPPPGSVVLGTLPRAATRTGSSTWATPWSSSASPWGSRRRRRRRRTARTWPPARSRTRDRIPRSSPRPPTGGWTSGMRSWCSVPRAASSRSRSGERVHRPGPDRERRRRPLGRPRDHRDPRREPRARMRTPTPGRSCRNRRAPSRPSRARRRCSRSSRRISGRLHLPARRDETARARPRPTR